MSPILPATAITRPGDLIPTLRGSPVRVTHAEMQRRPSADGKGDFGFVLVWTEPINPGEPA